MRELMYDQSSIVICTVLLVTMLLATEAGYRIGRRTQPGATEPFKAHVHSVQGSVLGILALLLGFTFSLALQRFDSRSVAVVDEANAIGTAYLRAQLLPTAISADARQSLRDYLALRIRASSLTLDQHEKRRALEAETTVLQDTLWRHAREGAEQDPRPAIASLFVQSINELIDSYGRRNAELNRHVPEPVLILLFGVFVIAGGIVGFCAGLGGHRPSLASHVMTVLIVILVFVIIDLDRPRRGLITISQGSLLELNAAIGNEKPASSP